MGKAFKVFGLGLNKTGTSSLKVALRRLGYEHFRRQGRMAHAYFERDWDALFKVTDDFESFEDWPWPLMYRELFARYGDSARYILTTRKSPGVWVESLKKHAVATKSGGIIRKNIYGYRYPHGVEAAHMAFYEAHNAAVRAFFAEHAPHLFLEVCWENGDGWPELCDFLLEPRRGKQFPHANKEGTAPPDPEVIAENERRIKRHLRNLKG